METLDSLGGKLDFMIDVQKGMLTEEKAELIMVRLIDVHHDNCNGPQDAVDARLTAERNTGNIDILKGVRRSFAPAARRIRGIPRWAQLIAGGISGVGIIAVAFRDTISEILSKIGG